MDNNPDKADEIYQQFKMAKVVWYVILKQPRHIMATYLSEQAARDGLKTMISPWLFKVVKGMRN
mgnify:CR=1